MYINLFKVKKIIGNKTLLNIDSLRLDSGKIYGIVGPNGAGKSTLLRILAGLDKEFDGEILYGYEWDSLQKFDKVRESIAMLHQKPYVFNMTVRENIELGIKLNGRENSELVNKIIDRLSLNGISDKSALKTSGGEAQRTSLGRLLALEPQLLLLDEPTANVDPENTRMIEKAINEMTDDKDRTIIIVTHNVFQALRLCDYVVYMEKGVISDIVEKENALKSKKLKELLKFTSSM
jgi:tungstate transport system ATP-binding protein